MKSGLYGSRRTTLAGAFWGRGLLLGAGLLCAGRLWACGPFFPDTILDADTRRMVAAPPASLATELAQLGQGRETSVSTCVHYGVAGTLPFELKELRDLLVAKGLNPEQCVRLLGVYSELRRSEALRPAEGHQEQSLQETEADAAQESALEPRAQAADVAGGSVAARAAEPINTAPVARSAEDLRRALAGLPAEIPVEFGLYLQGALCWRAGDEAQATLHWLGLLALPEAERKHRSVWAAYMLGRAALAEMKGLKGPEAERAGEESCRWFVQTRTLAAQGFADVAGLASESLGWEGQAALLKGDYKRALTCYFQQHQTGDETAFQSLRRTAWTALEQAGPSALETLAQDALCRRLVTAVVVSRARESLYDEVPEHAVCDGQGRAWCQALGKVPVGPLPEADHMAWLAYDAGEADMANNWLVHASDASPITWWLRAKLALREGDPKARAESFYREALARPGLDEGQLSRLQAELGRLCLARAEFEQALEVWMMAGDWEAAAYVAERILSTHDLQVWVEAHAAVGRGDKGLAGSLRYLLARRLARDGSEKAATYFSPALAETYRRYLAQVHRAYDEHLPNLVRGRAFMAAARTLRHHGMELMGTELAPDGFIYGGDFEVAERHREQTYGHNDPLDVNEAEREQLRQQPLPQQGRRFHYRYRAADLGWLGASLMPNDSEETAAMLCEAGSWLKNRDPGAADLFYKALVVRCPHTHLGVEAAGLHWFPVVPEEGEQTLGEPGSDWGVRPGWLLLCWGLAIAVPVGMAMAASRLRRRA